MKEINIFGELDSFSSKRYVDTAREALTYYVDDGVDLQHLLAILIGSSATPEICGKLASYGVRHLSEMRVNELQKEGLSEIQSQQILAAFQLANKLSKSKREERLTIRSPENAAKYLIQLIQYKKQEHFHCLYLNTKNQVIHERTVFIGSLNASIVHPREVYKEAFKHSAASIIVAHNHPSGDPTPSREDIDVTKRLIEVGEVMGIECLDHIVVGDDRYISLKEKGYI